MPQLLLRLSRIGVLVVDDWAMAPMAENERRDFWAICEERYCGPGRRAMVTIERLRETTQVLSAAIESRRETRLEKAGKTAKPNEGDSLLDQLTEELDVRRQRYLRMLFVGSVDPRGQTGYLMTAHDLVDNLGRAYREGRLDRRMKVYLDPRCR